MHYFQSYYFLEAQDILGKYEYPEPFHLFIKKYFKQHKKYGSRDRKIISALLYGFFRIGEQPHLGTTQAMAMGAFLTAELPHDWFKKYVIWGEDMYHVSVPEKLDFLEDQQIEIVIPTKNELCEGLSDVDYLESILCKPRVFIRVRKDKKLIQQALKKAEIDFLEFGEYAIGFEEGIDLSTILPIEKDYVIQDVNSQYVCSQFAIPANAIVWDCCAASGGKSIAAVDAQPTAQLLVSDIRDSILINLKERFTKYSIKNFSVFPHDATMPAQWVNNNMPHNSIDVILCDVPCTGSGTWARTPEQYYFQSEIDFTLFTERQALILQHTWPFLKPGGKLYYMTCSAFAAENEQLISTFLTNTSNAELVDMQLAIGIDMRADTMFIAELTKV